ncbi:MAG TPA: GIY-YIG nuclease family protein [Burkholderiales bacterium]|nr:GIY-YIG nuclease family protein [Burkholderiales bacterium]
MEKLPCVYILASKRNGTLYIGISSDLVKRVYEHKNGLADGFTRKYHVHSLV